MTVVNPSLPVDLIVSCRDRITPLNRGDKPSWLLVHVPSQTLNLLRDKTVVQVWPVSTARAGLDNRDGSGGTPSGLHRIHRKIGANAAPGTVFSSRRPTGEIWSPDTGPDVDERDLILTRILTLDGLEPGLNRGPGVDSRDRYIYLHGTNHPDLIGQPVSQGCVRLGNDHILELFELVSEGDPVVIV